MDDPRIKDLGKVDNEKAKIVVALSCFDEGVKNNHGRPGAKHGPLDILKRLESFYAHENFPHYQVVEILEEPPKLPNPSISLEKEQFLLHLGGGHDCIIHACQLVEEQYKLHHQTQPRFLMLNFDPHPDTRDPKQYSWTSGAGFFELSKNFPTFQDYHLIGASKRSISPQHIPLVDHIHWIEDISGRTNLFPLYTPEFLSSYDGFFISIDCDLINNFFGVSSPVARGMDFSLLDEHLRYLLSQSNCIGLGIYEYAPNLSVSTADEIRAAQLAYRVFESL